MVKLRPAPACANCGKTLEETKGRRLIIYRYWTSEALEKAGGHSQIMREVDEGKRPHEGVTTVEGTGASPGVLAASLQAFAAGMNAWICQRCGNRLCKHCGEPLVCPPMADMLYEDGNTSHGPWFGEMAGCVNPSCKNSSERRKSASATGA